MYIRRDILLGIGSLVAIVVLTAFGAIGLFSRMSPAIEYILLENDYSLAAAEDMLAITARTAERPATEAESAAFSTALSRAAENITEPEERAVIARIRDQAAPALQGSTAARVSLVDALQELTRINRDAMRRADEEAKRLGTAGAWSAVVLGFIGFAAGAIITALLLRRVVNPLTELYDTALAARRGERGRRCHVGAAPIEIAFVMRLVNDLFDERDRAVQQEQRTSSDSRFADRRVLLHLFDAREQPVAMIDGDGELVTASQSAMELLEGPDGARYREAFRRVADRGVTANGVVDAIEVPDASRWIVTLAQP